MLDGHFVSPFLNYFSLQQIMLHHLHQHPPVKDPAAGRGNHLAHPFRRGSDRVGGKDTDLNTVLGLSFPPTHPVHPAEEALFNPPRFNEFIILVGC